MNVIFVGDAAASATSPLKTWASSLAREHVKCIFPDPFAVSMSEWITIAKSADALIYQGYGITDPFMFRQLTLAASVGCPIIRKWSGSDIYYALKDEKIVHSVRRLNRITSDNFTSEHSGICDELSSIGINCKLLPQVVDSLNSFTPRRGKNNSAVLVYLPDSRYKFYGLQYVEKLIPEFPEIKFFIVADQKHRLAHYDNVESLGWVDNMEVVWEQVGLVLRITEHDGYPRTIVEALARGKYVIHNRAFEGCWFASDLDEIRDALIEFKKVKSINYKGLKTVEKLISGESDKTLAEAIHSVKSTIKTRFWGALFFLKLFILIKIKR